MVLEKKLEKEGKEHIWVVQRQLAFRVHMSTKETRLMLGEAKRKRRRKTVRKQKGGFIVLILAVLAPTAIDLIKKLKDKKWLKKIELLWLKDKHQKK